MTDNDLMLRCLDLDTKRKLLAEMKDQVAELADLVVGELRRRKLDRFGFLPNRAAVLSRATSTTIDVPRFRTAVIEAGHTREEAEAAISSRVLVTVAKSLLGTDALEVLSEHKLGDWAVKIVSASR